MKKQLAEDLILFTNPLRERITEIEKDDDLLNRVIRQGADKARESASKTLHEVRTVIGLNR
jgi:tryptophanyl-tRNA synthetase